MKIKNIFAAVLVILFQGIINTVDYKMQIGHQTVGNYYYVIITFENNGKINKRQYNFTNNNKRRTCSANIDVLNIGKITVKRGKENSKTWDVFEQIQTKIKKAVNDQL